MGIGIEGVGCSSQDLLALATIQTLLGGGDSFSAGGPGKGLKSRIFVNILYNQGVLSASALNVSYAETGLFGISATTTPEHTTAMVSLPLLCFIDTGVCREWSVQYLGDCNTRAHACHSATSFFLCLLDHSIVSRVCYCSYRLMEYLKMPRISSS